MKNRYLRRKRRRLIMNILTLPLIVILAFGAIKTGIMAGNMLFDMDKGFIRKIDTDNFKMTLNSAIPLIDTIYNSGNVNASLSGEIKNIIKYVFNFDLNTPLTVLNAQSPLFYSYYYHSYLPMLAGRDSENKAENGMEKVPQNEEAENKVAQNDPVEEPELPQLLEDASSIAYEGETDEKQLSKSDIISSGKIVLRNETNFKISEAEISKLLKEPLKFEFDKKKDKVLVYHTHTTEGYIKSLDELKKQVADRTRDTKYNVVRVGDELTRTLEKKYGIEILHNGTIHDYPYNSSYSNSLKTIDKYLKSYPTIKIAFDIHRDGLGISESKLRLVKKVNGKDAAQVMFVVGTNGTGLNHPAWKENLKLAIKLQQKLNEQCPGLAKPIYISKNRYNQHMTKGSLIIEVGGDGNLMSECLESTKYLAKAINEVIK